MGSELEGGRVRRMLSRINGVVAVVLVLFSFIYYTVAFVVVLPWLSYSVPGVLHLGLFTMLTGLAMWSYLCCVFRDPGKVPAGWVPNPENGVQEVKRKGSGEARYCQKCEEFKPPRTHHCRVCKRCVLRMDHHCMWINNCVGHANYKTFFLFVLYVTGALVHALLLLCSHSLAHSNRRRTVVRKMRGGRMVNVKMMAPPPNPGLETGVFWALVKVLCTTFVLPLVIALAMLLFWNVYLLVSNKTTIEYHEGVRSRRSKAEEGAERDAEGGEAAEGEGGVGEQQQQQHIYDVGLCGNLHAALGAAAPCWMCPLQCAAAGNGLSYPTSVGDTAGRGGAGGGGGEGNVTAGSITIRLDKP